LKLFIIQLVKELYKVKWLQAQA